MRHEEEKGLDGESVRGNGLGGVQSMGELSIYGLINNNYPVEFCGGALRKCKWRSRL